MGKRRRITFGELLNALDWNRWGSDMVRIMGNNGEVLMEAETGSPLWDALEDRLVNSMRPSDAGVMDVWFEN